jgi:hypothetical protein
MLLRLEPTDIAGVHVLLCDTVVCEVVAKTPHRGRPLDAIVVRYVRSGPITW